MKKEAIKIINSIRNEISSNKFMNKFKNNKQDFSRNRKLSFTPLILFILNSIKSTIQKELTNFMELISDSSKNAKFISKSAFSQSRAKLNPDAFIHLNNVLNKEFYTDNDYTTWNNHRLLSIDGSNCQLPHSTILKNHFGHTASDNFRNFPIARISYLYDILNEITIDSKIVPLKIGECSLALQHLEKIQKKDLIIMDRGYRAIWLFYLILQKKGDFVVRLRQNFNKEVEKLIESNDFSQIIKVKKPSNKSQSKLNELKIQFEPFNLRLVKVILDNGEIEIIATSLTDTNKYPTGIFKNLYFMRWGIEINYDHLKNQIEIEKFSGRTILAIEQDFYANILMSNFQSLIIKDTKEEMDKENKKCEYDYKINKNLSFAYMKDRFIKIMLSDDPDYFKQLKELFKVEPVPIRKGRKFDRPIKKRRKKYSMNKRRAV